MNRTAHKILYINPIGGLANRMRFMCGAICLAKSLGVDWRIVWNVNWELGATFEQLFEEHCDVSGRIIYPSKFQYAIGYSIPRKQNLYLTHFTSKRFGKCFFSEHPLWASEDKEKRLQDELKAAFRTSEHCYIQGGIDCHPYPPEYYRKLFQPIASIKLMVEQTRKLLTANYIGIHIRRTDNIKAIQVSTDERFAALISTQLEKKTDCKFYLASDDEHVKQELSATFPGKIIIEKSRAERGTSEGVATALKEMLILSNSSEIYGSFYSSFSEAAAILGNVPLIVVR